MTVSAGARAKAFRGNSSGSERGGLHRLRRYLQTLPRGNQA